MKLRPLAITIIFLLIGLEAIPSELISPATAAPKPSKRSTKTRKRYVPISTKPPKGSITNSGVRGCSDSVNSIGKFTALAPVFSVGQTIATHPTFAWYMPSQKPSQKPRKLKFQLGIAGTDFQESQNIIYQTELDSRSGIMQLRLPASVPALSVGAFYRWRVILSCSPGKPSADQIVGAEVEVVAADIAGKIDATADRGELSQQYAESGLWYDAFDAALELPAIRNELLNDLIDLEKTAAGDPIIEQSAALQSIVNQ
jgi:hypothetical protein